ncbi:MAG: hypothetical protein K6G64_00675 [Eubacterium sp.]|nr:hypothetical protein [Eubacterium sp.]
MTFREDGSIQKVEQTKRGVENVDVVNPADLTGNNSKPNPEDFVETTNYSAAEATLFGDAQLEGDGATGLVHSSGDASGDGYFLKFDKTSGWSDYGKGVARCFVDLKAGSDNTVKVICGMGGVNITGMSISLKNQSQPVSRTEISLNGSQISDVLEGFRIVFSVSDPANEIQETGMIYGLMDYVTKENLILERKQKSVYAYSVNLAKPLSRCYETGFDQGKSYALTMKLLKNRDFYTSEIGVRAYAKLKDGSVIYSNPGVFNIYHLADVLHQNQKMSNLQGHDYLYQQILTKVNPNYQYCDYHWNHGIAILDE